MRTLAPVAIFAAFCLGISGQKRPQERRDAFPGSLVRPAFFLGSLLALTWWIFSSLELFPLVFTLAFSLLVWGRPRPAAPTSFERIVFSRWAPAAAAVLVVLVASATGGRFDPVPLGFALLPFLPFPLDRGRLRSFFRSPWSAATLGALLLAIDAVAWARFDFALSVCLLLTGVLVLGRRTPPQVPAEKGGSVLYPALLGILSALAVGLVWGSLAPVPSFHDEASYLLQAKLFTEGRWKVPSPPLPEFFEQFHVLMTPVMASKYPPGHALLLAAGVWTGAPALVPLALTGITGALLFALARRVANSQVALLAWLMWVGSPRNLDYRSTYLSDVTTGALWLLGWWMLLRWKETGRPGFLLGLSACVGWGAITRELTTVAFAIPAAVVVLGIAKARCAWRDVGLAAAAGAAILLVIPFWNSRTTGDWRVSPRALYTQQYMPYDLPGFGPGAPRPTRDLPPELRSLNVALEGYKDRHTISRLPSTLLARARNIEDSVFGNGSSLLFPFALAGLFQLCAAGVLALATGALLLLLYLSYWHMNNWTAYYMELFPVICLVTALGIAWFVSTLAGILARRASDSARVFAVIKSAGVVLFSVVLAATAVLRIERIRSEKKGRLAEQADFRLRIREIREPAIVFVRYETRRDMHRSLVQNEDDPARLLVWVVHDRGEDNQRLLQAVPGRKPYLFDEARRTLLAGLKAPFVARIDVKSAALERDR